MNSKGLENIWPSLGASSFPSFCVPHKHCATKAWTRRIFGCTYSIPFFLSSLFGLSLAANFQIGSNSPRLPTSSSPTRNIFSERKVFPVKLPGHFSRKREDQPCDLACLETDSRDESGKKTLHSLHVSSPLSHFTIFYFSLFSAHF